MRAVAPVGVPWIAYHLVQHMKRVALSPQTKEVLRAQVCATSHAPPRATPTLWHSQSCGEMAPKCLVTLCNAV